MIETSTVAQDTYVRAALCNLLETLNHTRSQGAVRQFASAGPVSGQAGKAF